MKNFNLIFATFVLSLSTISCSNDDSQGGVAIKARASFTNPSAGKMASALTLNSFVVNLKEIEFELDESHVDDSNDSSDDNGFFDCNDDVKLKGPFKLDLLNLTAPLAFVDIPNGKYEEVEFKMDKNEVASDEMFGKSILMKGTIAGKPFIFWHNNEEEIEVDFEDLNQDVVVTDGTITVNINFDLNKALSTIDFSTAKDGDNDGVIEIGPNDTDGNQSLANLIKDKIEDATDLD